jgi:hypothetical protein
MMSLRQAIAGFSPEAVAADVTPVRAGVLGRRVADSADHLVELVGAEDAKVLLAELQWWMRSTWFLVAHWIPPGVDLRLPCEITSRCGLHAHY